MFLIDTNIWLELLLSQERAKETKLNNLDLISFDRHFEKTDLGYKTPSEVKI